jgi:hypothetical protein
VVKSLGILGILSVTVGVAPIILVVGVVVTVAVIVVVELITYAQEVAFNNPLVAI